MSATLRIEDFVENPILFKVPPQLIHVPARQFPVQVHFSRVTPDNYLLAAYKKVMQIHRKLPAGGILVFVTGQQEVRTLVRQLSQLYNSSSLNKKLPDPVKTKRKEKNSKVNKTSASQSNALRTFDLDELEAAPLISMEEEDDDNLDEDEILDSEWTSDVDDIPSTPLYVLPLYSMLPNNEQQKASQHYNCFAVHFSKILSSRLMI
jgi:ATP-dependent RNA helicase DHX37/DHR1